MYFEVNGRQAFATTGGKAFDKGRPVVIFLHGSGLDHTFWGLHSRFFAFRNYAVLVPDFPGHTHSEGPHLNSIEEMADWLNEAVEVFPWWLIHRAAWSRWNSPRAFRASCAASPSSPAVRQPRSIRR
jgi:pimeloyl-ACP methyl ester carboxylesterase